MYFQNLKSLEEKALIQVVIDRCQTNDFKETGLCLEKPVYGAFIPRYEGSFFLSNPEYGTKEVPMELCDRTNGGGW